MGISVNNRHKTTNLLYRKELFLQRGRRKPGEKQPQDSRTPNGTLANRTETNKPNENNMNEDEKKKMEAEQAAAAAEEQAAAGDAAAAAAEGEAAQEELSMADKNRQWMQGANPDLDMEDEDAYNTALNGVFNDYDKYKNSVGKMREAIDEDSMFGQMVVEALNNKDFNPIAWLRENTGMDMTKAMDDETFAKAMGEANQNWLERQSKSKEIKAEVEKNFPQSKKAIASFAKEQGQSDEERMAMTEQMFNIIDEAVKGNYTDLYKAMYLSGNFDNAVSNARAEGEAAGRQTKVRETLRQMPKTTSRGGSQQPMPERKPEQPKKKSYNPFV